MKYLITGSSGVIGGYLTEHLLSFNNEICMVNRSGPGEFSNSNSIVNSVIGNIVDRDFVNEVIKDLSK